MNIKQPNPTSSLEQPNKSKKNERQLTYIEVQVKVSEFQKNFGRIKSENRKILEQGYISDDEYEKIQSRIKLMEGEYNLLMRELALAMHHESTQNRTRYEKEFLFDLSQDQRDLVESKVGEIYSKHPIWHGTGKFHYASFGGSKYDGINHSEEPVQALASILQKGIVPAYDPNAEKSVGTQRSTSLTRQRMLARAVADTRLCKGEELKFTYGSTLYWLSLFLRQEKLEEFLLRKASAVNQAQQWISDANNETIITDGSDVISAISQTRSTIKGNFPVIIGIDSSKVATKDIQKINISAESEIRTIEPIPVSAFTHIEVPWQNIEETKILLQKLNIDLPVLPIEEGERWMSYHKN